MWSQILGVFSDYLGHLLSVDDLILGYLQALFLFEEIAASWPIELGADAASSISAISAASSLNDLTIAARADANPVKLQSALLAKQALEASDKEECQILYCWVAFNLLQTSVLLIIR